MDAGNSKALEPASITAESKASTGGKILRGAAGTASGVREENAFYGAMTKLLKPRGAKGFQAYVHAGAEPRPTLEYHGRRKPHCSRNRGPPVEGRE